MTMKDKKRNIVFFFFSTNEKKTLAEIDLMRTLALIGHYKTGNEMKWIIRLNSLCFVFVHALWSSEHSESR